MAGRLEGKTAIVTGGGSGMGRAGSVAFAAEGAAVVVADIDAARARRVVDQIVDGGGTAVVGEVDVADIARVRQLVEETVSRFGRIDVLYHCAADVAFINSQDRRLTELREEVWQRMLDVHLTGTFLVCKYVGRQMLAQRSGSIILTATTDALIGCAGLDSYTAAKGGVVALTRSFAAGLGADGVRVNAICPGFVATEPQLDWLTAPGAAESLAQLHLLPIAEPHQIAPFAVYLASDESVVVTGGIFPIDSGYMAFKANLDVMATIQAGLRRDEGR